MSTPAAPAAHPSPFDTPSTWPVDIVSRGGVHLAVRRHGGGDAVLMLHGFSDDSGCWGVTATSLVDDGWRVALLDARGHGQSPMPAGEPFTTAEHAADAAAVLDTLHWPAVVIGHSMGAMTGLALTAAHPDRVRALVMEDPPFALPVGHPADDEHDRRNDFEAGCREQQELGHDALLARGREEHPSWPEDELEPWAVAKERLDLGLFRAPQIWLRRSWQEAALSLSCPTMLVTGEPELGAALTPEAARWFEEHTDVRVERVAGAGHNVRREARNAWLRLLRDFLTDVRLG